MDRPICGVSPRQRRTGRAAQVVRVALVRERWRLPRPRWSAAVPETASGIAPAASGRPCVALSFLGRRPLARSGVPASCPARPIGRSVSRLPRLPSGCSSRRGRGCLFFFIFFSFPPFFLFFSFLSFFFLSFFLSASLCFSFSRPGCFHTSLAWGTFLCPYTPDPYGHPPASPRRPC
ncbi:hypothetical protein VTN02DRAFT_4419 [Thermoascus thermophilus]